ncbi:MAG: hypothetical protein WDN06_13110 [Asticcacaulis sp.]
MLADPIVKLLMTRDGVDPDQVRLLMGKLRSLRRTRLQQRGDVAS